MHFILNMTFCSSNKVFHLGKALHFICSQLSALHSLSTFRRCVFSTFLSNHQINMRLMPLFSSQTYQSVLTPCFPWNHWLGQLQHLSFWKSFWFVTSACIATFIPCFVLSCPIFLETLLTSWHHNHRPCPNSGRGTSVSWAVIRGGGSPARLSKLPASLVLLTCQPSLAAGPITPTLFFISSGPSATASSWHGLTYSWLACAVHGQVEWLFARDTPVIGFLADLIMLEGSLVEHWQLLHRISGQSLIKTARKTK